MPEYLSPGVYVEEVDTGPKPIEGVSTSTAGMVGVCERGPVNVPTLVTGWADFMRQFGGILNRRVFTGGTWYLPHAVKGFFDNGGKRVYVVRVLPDTATAAQALLFDRGSPTGANTRLAVAALQGASALLAEDDPNIGDEDWLRLDDQGFSEYVQASLPTTPPLPDRGARTLRTPLHYPHAAGPATPVTVLALDPVPNPNDLLTTLSADVAAGETQIHLTSRDHVVEDDILRIGADPQREFVVVNSVPSDPTDLSVRLRHPVSLDHAATDAVERMQEGALGAATQLNQNANPGMGVAILDDTGAGGVDFDPGDIVRFGASSDDDREYHLLAGLHTPGSDPRIPILIALHQAARGDHAIGEPIQVVTLPDAGGGAAFDQPLAADVLAGNSTVTLAAAAQDLAEGDVVRIGSGSTQEFLVVASVPADPLDQTIGLNYPLAFDHPDSDHVVRADRTAGANATVSVRSANAGDLSLMVADETGLIPNTLVEIGTPDSDEVEYQALGSPIDLLLFTVLGLSGMDASGGLAFDHAQGTPVLGREPLLRVEAIDRGAWGNCLRVRIEDDTPLLETTAAANPNPADASLALASAVGAEIGTVLDVDYPAGTAQRKVIAVAGKTVTLSAAHGVAVPAGTRVRSREFRLTVECLQTDPRSGSLRAVASETQRWLSMDPRHSRYATRVLGAIFRTELTTPRRADGRTEGESGLIRVEDALADDTTGVLSLSAQAQAENSIRLGPDLIWDYPSPFRRVAVGRWLANGDDAIGAISDNTYVGVDSINPRERQGLYSLKNIEEISIVAIPGRTSQTVEQELITHCELMRYRFAVLDSEPGLGVAEVREQRGLYDTRYGALYYPWLRIVDPFPDNPRAPGLVSIPPSGHMMGIYARSDIERGVHKAPANEVIRSINDLEVKITKEEQDILNPININVLRNFRESNRGLRVWGARTLSSDSDWKYVNVRRLFIFVEHSIDRGTQWVVFEPNSELLWERVRRVISSFLNQVWRDGALMGRTPEEAFFVKCDRTTMTQNDIDNGRLICLIGIAPVKPAEFVIFRIGQWIGGSDVEEG